MTPPDTAAVIPHPWIGEAGQWRCSRCSAVCDHDEPCGRHGSCAPLPDSMTPAALCTWRDQGRVCRENREWHDEGTDHPFTEPTSAALDTARRTESEAAVEYERALDSRQAVDNNDPAARNEWFALVAEKSSAWAQAQHRRLRLEAPTFEELLRDPTQQFDPKGEILRSVMEYQNATKGTMDAF